MDMVWNNETSQPFGAVWPDAEATIALCLAAAAGGDASAYFDLGVICSTDTNSATHDLVEAHKWFNIAASQGHEEAAFARAQIAEEMTAREIAEAQRRARAWLSAQASRAA